MLIPIGLDEARVARIPWVSIGIVALCVTVQVAGWLGDAQGRARARLRDAVGYWAERPYLELPSDAEDRFEIDARTREELTREHAGAMPRGDVALEQGELERRWEELVEAYEALPERRYGLVPARGAAQVGWVTNLFVHADLWHLLGNMLVFFLVVGPFLEDAWGRAFFAVFYVAGGLVAGFAQALPMHGSQTAIIGASGAISACLGAFALRFAHRRVRMVYWFWLFVRGSFLVPAWLYALGAFALDLLALGTQGASAGVAYGAHVGGFLFGLVTAVGLRASGVEARLTPEGVAGPSRTLRGARADEALQHGDLWAARQGYEDVLSSNPDDPEALSRLLELSAKAFDHDRVTRCLERLVSLRLAAGDASGARGLVREFGPLANPGDWRPATALRVAELLSETDGALADRFDEAVEGAGGALAAKALLRRAERTRGASASRALDLAQRASELSGTPLELARRAQAMVEELRAEVEGDARTARDPSAPTEVDPAPGRAAGSGATPALGVGEPVRLVPCQLQDVVDGRLRLVTRAGRPAELAPDRVAAVAAGLVRELAEGGEVLRDRVVLDLLVHPRDGQQGRVLVRLVGHAMPLARLFPGLPSLAAFGRLVEGILDASGAAALPTRAEAAGRPLRTYVDADEFERASWGRRVSS